MRTKEEIFDQTFKGVFGCEFKDTMLTPHVRVACLYAMSQYAEQEMKQVLDSNSQKEVWSEALDYCVEHYFNDVRLLEEIMTKYHIIRK